MEEKYRNLILRNLDFYRGLDDGSLTPSTEAQQHFVEVCRGHAEPQTDHEIAYLMHKRNEQDTGVDERSLIASDLRSLDKDSDPESVLQGELPVRPCSNCGRAISQTRLELLPHATCCVDCQEQQEADASGRVSPEAQCPRCAQQGIKSSLVWRTARDPGVTGYFLGCSRYPDCRYVDRD